MQRGDPDDASDPVEVPIGDELDLHTFAPRDVPELVRHYLDECAARGMTQVRIIHGKGMGALRQTVQTILERHRAVFGFSTPDESGGGWGATVVRLRGKGA